jgi:catechol 2,3-dioxygenase-like lactoylglutathione lyase family enzyme
MFDHVGVQCRDLAASRRFFEQLLAPLQITVAMDYGEALGFAGPDGFPTFWISQTPLGGGSEEVHLAFRAQDRTTVEAVHTAAVALEAEVLHAPREWPEYHEGYYGVFVRDLDGNNVEAVCHQ